MTQTLDEAIVAYVWQEGSATPGRYPERVIDDALRTRVTTIVGRLDAVRPGADAVDLPSWADREARAAAAIEPEVGESGIAALRALLSWTWR